jgi:hypothetical protein
VQATGAVFDALSDGRRLKILTVVDEFSRFALLLGVNRLDDIAGVSQSPCSGVLQKA